MRVGSRWVGDPWRQEVYVISKRLNFGPPFPVRSMRAAELFFFRFVFLILVPPALSAFGYPCAGQGRGFTVTGRVVEVTNATWIGGATVTLSERPPFISNQRGEFRFENVSAGTHTLRVQAMGYRSQDVSIQISADTDILVEMEVDPIRLDSLLVEAGTVSIRGIVVDAATGARIPEARIQAGRAPETFATSRGAFRVKDLPRGHSIPIVVDALKYRSVRIALITERDTTLTIPMEADPVSIRLFQETLEDLEVRSRSVSLSRTQLNRRYIQMLPSRSVGALLQWHLRGGFNSDCLFVDEIKYPYPEILESYKAAEVERIEIYGRGAMIRVYTQEFVARHFGRAHELPPITYIRPSMQKAICH